jgi:hypothetical protein
MRQASILWKSQSLLEMVLVGRAGTRSGTGTPRDFSIHRIQACGGLHENTKRFLLYKSLTRQGLHDVRNTLRQI